MVQSTDWVSKFRLQIPVVHRFNYLNTGTAGPLPQVVADAVAAEAERESHEGRGNFTTWSSIPADRTRVLAARVMGADADEIALAHHSSDGVNIVIWGLDWRPGDEVVTTTLEHDAAAVPLGLLRDRYGVVVRFAEIGMGEQALAGIEAALSKKTKLAVLSHLVYSTGALLPAKQLTDLCHRAGVMVLLDGAQTCGALPLDVHALGADFYTLSGQKWLCGPEGTGALYVRREMIARVHTTFSSYYTARSHDFRGNLQLHDSAKRFEVGTFYRPGLAGLARSMEWLLDEVGLDRAWSRSLELAKLAREKLRRIDGVEILSPPEMASQLLAFDLPAFSPRHLHATAIALARERRIVIRSIDHPPYALRASLGFFNTEEEVALLVEAIATTIEHGPGAIPLEGVGLTLPESRKIGKADT